VEPDSCLENRSRSGVSQDYDSQIIGEDDACKHCELGRVLRRKRVYRSQLKYWRRKLAEQGGPGLSKTAPGPAAAKAPEQRHIEQLTKDNQRLNDELQATPTLLPPPVKRLFDARSPEQWELCVSTPINQLDNRLTATKARPALYYLMPF